MPQDFLTTRPGSLPCLTFGVDLGGTSTRVGLYDEAMQLQRSHAMPTRVAAGPQACMEEIGDAIQTLCDQHQRAGNHFEVMGAGIGSPGPINLRTGVLGLLPNLPGWDNFPIRVALEAAARMPVTLESDANAAAIAEWRLGCGRDAGVKSMAMITLGTGVGSGLILDGRVWHGMFGMGGEVGHMTVDPNGLLCGCGSRGCLEMYASANGVKRLALEAGGAARAPEELKALAAKPDFTPLDVAELADSLPEARAVFSKLGRYLGIGVANLINTLDLPMIVVGGGVASSWALFAPAMFEAIAEYSVVYRLATPEQQTVMEQDRTYICPAALGPSAGLLGAALLPRLAMHAPAAANSSLTDRMAR